MLISSETKFNAASPKSKRNKNIVWGLLVVILLAELIRDSFKKGDFIGYLEAGNFVLNQSDIYASFLNTWPPFFSIFSAPIALGEQLLGSFGIRFIWELGSILSFFYLVSISATFTLGKGVGFFKTIGQKISRNEALILVPILLCLRFILDNLANIQINIYLLLACILMIQLYFEKRFLLLGFILALTISLKVLPIFLFFYFLIKRELKPVLWTLLFLALINFISFVVFGTEQAIHYYQQWMTEVAPRGYTVNHKNQSMFGALLRFLTAENYNQPAMVNFASLGFDQAKHVVYLIFGIASLAVAFLFRKANSAQSKLQTIFEFSIVLTAIPLLSPLSWKAYFIFSWLSIFITYLLLYRVEQHTTPSYARLLKILFWTSMILCTGSSELFLGRTLARILECWSVVAIGTTLLVVTQVLILVQFKNFKQQIISVEK